MLKNLEEELLLAEFDTVKLDDIRINSGIKLTSIAERQVGTEFFISLESPDQRAMLDLFDYSFPISSEYLKDHGLSSKSIARKYILSDIVGLGLIENLRVNVVPVGHMKKERIPASGQENPIAPWNGLPLPVKTITMVLLCFSNWYKDYYEMRI